jgi:autotransporter-associated beta strand protein
LQGKPIKLGGAVANLSANNQAIDLDGMELAAGSGSFDTGPSSIDIGSPLSGAGKALTKTGAGTLILRGNDSYSGGTTVSAGILEIANAGALPPGAGLTIGTGGAIAFQSGLAAMGLNAAAVSDGSVALRTAAVPEPSTLALFGISPLGLLACWRRRR